jgi:hypothetical protein
MRRRHLGFLVLIALLIVVGCGGSGGGGTTTIGDTNGVFASSAVVLAYNDLGMHCMNEDFSEFMILPPANTMHAVVLARGEEPRFLTSGITVQYSIPGNTHSADKTNFWTYAPALFGQNIPANIGLTGNGLAGTMAAPSGLSREWTASAVPITPRTDAGAIDAYQLAKVTVSDGRAVIAQTQAVMPVSWEINCAQCHNGEDAPGILQAHDQMHGTHLQTSTPVKCGQCHAQAPLGAAAPGVTGVPPLSTAMHGAHANRMDTLGGGASNGACYACHPGANTKCLRDVHFSRGMTCASCHTSMTAVGSPTRRPWVDEPRCGGCHAIAGHQYEQANTLYRNSVGHHGVPCEACHGSPHAITPTVVANDNAQAIGLQGHSGPINTCAVCHNGTPDDGFTHAATGE